MRGWLRRSGAAAGLAGEAVELWLPASLATLPLLGWMPLALAIVPLPNAADLAFFGASLYSSSHWPQNLLTLLVAVAVGLLTANALVALGEAALLRALFRGPARRRLFDDVARTWMVQLLASLPAIGSMVILLLAIVVVAPAEYQSPDIGGPLAWRIARDLLAPIALMVVALGVGRAFSAAATRRAIGPGPLSTALVEGARDLVRAPARAAALLVVTSAAVGAGLLLSFGLLKVLWGPIELQLRGGSLGGPQTLLLLVGFVAIWLCLVLALGVLHAWASAWWSFELPVRSQEAATH